MIDKILLSAVLGLFTAGHAHAQDQSAKAPGGLSDKQIAEVLITINNAEIKAAKLAQQNATNADVKAFADQMIKEHSENRDETKKVLKKNGLAAEDSETSRSVREDSRQTEKALKKHVSTNFDKAYIDSQVKMHDHALTMIRNNLEPHAQNAALRALLADTATHVEEHLAKAKELESKVQ